jgi:hypothetical protein
VLNGRGRRGGPSGAPAARKAPQEATEAAHLAYVLRTYRVTAERYYELQRFQWAAAGRRLLDWRPGLTLCWGCRRARGRAKRLATDHNHRTGEVRMFLCSTCNNVVGHFRDDPVALVRLGLALIDPPSRLAWMAEGSVRPGWVCDDQELLDLLDDV